MLCFSGKECSEFPKKVLVLIGILKATKKWTSTIRSWAQVYGELSIMYEGRLPE